MELIPIDLNASTTGKDSAWQMCVGSGHAALALRKDWCDYIRRVHEELGIRYVRFHGILDDDLLTIQRLSDFIPLPYANQVREYSFRQVGKVYDNVLSTGMKPFVEISFMPRVLASGKKTGLHYKNNITPPKDYDQWADYIKAFIQFLLKRYGKSEVESWYFEVWNEPDLKVFYTGSQQEYFKFYAYTAKAIKSCDEALRVGGPSTSASRWIPEFIEYVTREKLPCDFISTHQYPGDGFGNEFKITDVFSRYPSVIKKAAKNGKGIAAAITELFYDPESVRKTPKGIMKTVLSKARKQAGDYPLFYTEWNCTSVFGSPEHDEKYCAAYAVKTILDMERETDCFSFWNCNDLYEEIMFINQPFHGGFGLISNLGLPKPIFWAFKILAGTYHKRLSLPTCTNQAVEYAAFTDGEKVQVILYAQDHDPDKDQEHTVRLSLNRAFQKMTIMRIDEKHCNPKKLWQDMGCPMDPSPEEVNQIMDGSSLREEPCPFEVTEEGCSVQLTLRTNDVVMLNLQQEGATVLLQDTHTETKEMPQ